MTSPVPARPRPMAGVDAIWMPARDKRALIRLARTYGVDDVIRALRIWQMTQILEGHSGEKQAQEP